MEEAFTEPPSKFSFLSVCSSRDKRAPPGRSVAQEGVVFLECICRCFGCASLCIAAIFLSTANCCCTGPSHSSLLLHHRTATSFRSSIARGAKLLLTPYFLSNAGRQSWCQAVLVSSEARNREMRVLFLLLLRGSCVCPGCFADSLSVFGRFACGDKRFQLDRSNSRQPGVAGFTSQASTP